MTFEMNRTLDEVGTHPGIHLRGIHSTLRLCKAMSASISKYDKLLPTQTVPKCPSLLSGQAHANRTPSKINLKPRTLPYPLPILIKHPRNRTHRQRNECQQ